MATTKIIAIMSIKTVVTGHPLSGPPRAGMGFARIVAPSRPDAHGTPEVIAFEKKGKTSIINRELYAALMKRFWRP
jgi:hypothetical protein